MGARLTLGLVLLAAATLVLGYAAHNASFIYVSIACSAVAAIGLLFSSRRRRRRPAEPEGDLSWPAALAEPAATSPAGRRPVQPEPPRTESLLGAPLRPVVPPSTAARRRAAGQTRTIPSPSFGPFSEPDPGSVPQPVSVAGVDSVVEPEGEPSYAGASPVSRVAAPAATAATARTTARAPVAPSTVAPESKLPRRNPFVSEWVQSEPAEQPSARRPAAVAPSTRPVAAAVVPVAPAAAPPPIRPAPAPTRRRPPAPPVEAYPFPIEDYEYLDVGEILPLLPELDDQELVEVLVFEQAGPNREAILNRIDILLEGEDW